MPRPKKTLEAAPEGKIQQLLGRLANKHANVMTAAVAMEKVRYLDFSDPHTGLPSIVQEYLLGSRGFIAGRIAQLRATYSKGKSSYCMLQYASAQKNSKAYCMHIETEGSCMPADRCAIIGVNPNELLQSESSSLEECFATVDELVCEIRGGFGGSVGEMGRMKKTVFTDPIDPDCEAPILIGIDSLSALGKEDKVMQDVADVGKVAQIGSTAKTLREYFRNRVQRFNQVQATLFLTTQETVKLDTSMKGMFAGPQKTSVAAEAIGIHATYGIDFESKKWMDKTKGVQLGDILTLKTFKNKWAPRNRSVELYLTQNNGFDLIHSDVEFLLNHPSSPFADMGKDCYRWGDSITCKPLSDKPFKSEEEFLRAFYADEELLRSCREKLGIRGFGFEFETKYANFDTDGNLAVETEEPDSDVKSVVESKGEDYDPSIPEESPCPEI